MPPGTADVHIAILACKAGREFHVRDQVRAFGVQCYLPKYLVNLRREGMVARPLFGCYMFVWMTDEWRQLSLVSSQAQSRSISRDWRRKR
jgi:hypothetical protein